MGEKMKILMYGQLKPNKPWTHSMGSGSGYRIVNDKQYARELKKFQKYMAKQ